MSRLPFQKGIARREHHPNQPIPIRANQRNSSSLNSTRAGVGLGRDIGGGFGNTNGRNVKGGPKRSPGEIPYVSPDGGKTRYYADRFYLDAPTGLLEYQLSQNNSGNDEESNVEYCNYCGEMRSPPHDQKQQRSRWGTPQTQTRSRPLFDRAKFINSLDLSAAIIGTYTIGGLDFLSETFPTLFPPPFNDDDSNKWRFKRRNYVPTLVLHGHKALKLECSQSESSVNDNHSSQSQHRKTMQHKGDQCCPGSENVKTLQQSNDAISKDPVKENDVKVRGCSPSEAIAIDSDSETEECTNGNIQIGANKNNEEMKLQQENKTTKGVASDLVTENTNNTDSIANKMPVQNEAMPVAPMPQSQSILSPLRQPTPPQSILSQVLGTTNHSSKSKKSKSTIMQPILYHAEQDSSDDESSDAHHNGFASKRRRVKEGSTSRPSSGSSDGIGSDENVNGDSRCGSPTAVFGGEVFFTQVLPRWCPPSKSKKAKRGPSPSNLNDGTTKLKSPHEKSNDGDVLVVDISDDESGEVKRDNKLNRSGSNSSSTERPSPKEDEAEFKNVLGVHHPKFFLLFEKSGSLVVIVSTCNLSSQNAIDASWVQRFERKETFNNALVDSGMPSDFGAILTDLLTKQSEAAADGSMLPDLFLRRYVDGFSSGLNALADRYCFEDAQVHLVSTVPGDYSGCLPQNGMSVGGNPYMRGAARPVVTYGPQRVAFILSRIMNEGHIRSARSTAAVASSGRFGGSKMETILPWHPPALISKMDRLVFQPTSFGGTWARNDMEAMTNFYLQPYWRVREDNHETGPIALADIVWPSIDYFDTMDNERAMLQKKHPRNTVVAKRPSSDNSDDRTCHVFLSSLSFIKLDRSCISRMSLFQPSYPLQLPYVTASLHFKSICRLFTFDNKPATAAKSSQLVSNNFMQQKITESEYLSWFMLTSSCFSRGAQGQPTPYRGDSDSTSYSNFELGVLFCSRLLGDRIYDRLYSYSPTLNGCQCKPNIKRWYKEHLSEDSLSKKGENDPSFLNIVRKVHLPIPYELRPNPYQDDPDSDFMSYTPYLHEIPSGTGDVGNMKLTPLGQRLARESSLISNED